jgi:ATP-dependent DNA ligase
VNWDTLKLKKHAPHALALYAFDLIEQNGDDLRRDPIEVRKATLN